MEISYLIIGFFVGGILGAVILYFVLKSSSVSRNIYDELNNQFIKINSDLQNSQLKIDELNNFLQDEKQLNFQQSDNINELKNNLATATAENNAQSQKIAEQNDLNQKQISEIRNLLDEKQQLIAAKSQLSAQNETLQKLLDSQKEEITKIQEQAKEQFENLANKILEEKTEKFTMLNQNNLRIILSPLQEKISDFEKKVENTHKESIDYHSALRQQILGLRDLNLQMSKETLNLTKALKGDTKIQGNWGELILERVLEKSGLEKDREYEIQKSHTTEERNRLQPDVIINLPDGKKMIIDSKVSLVAYEKYINEENEENQNLFLKEHLLSLKRHIDNLSNKNYHDLYQQSPNFVLLFIPIEPAFAIALNNDKELYNKAFEKNIVIVTPTTLLATLSTINSMWTTQKHQDNAYEIARQAGALYDKFDGFVNNLIKVGKKMDEAKIEYEGAMNKLVEGKGNLVKSVQKLKIMGAKTNKVLPPSLISRSQTEDDEIPQSLLDNSENNLIEE